MQEYIISIVVGLAFGGIIGYIKYAALWKKMLKTDESVPVNAVYIRFGISYLINIVTLFFVFFTRNMLPLNYMLVIASVAVALVVAGRLAPASSIVTRVKEDK